MRSRTLAALMAAMLLFAVPLIRGQSPAPRVGYTTYEEARPILEALSEAAPAELRAATASGLPSAWDRWVARRDREIRARLVQGDEDSLINFLLFGTSFTRRPRITLKALAQVAAKGLDSSSGLSPEEAGFVKAIESRADDLVRALVTPGANERLLFARRLVEAKGYDVKTAQGRERAREYLLAGLTRMFKEQAGYARVLESARLLGDPSAEFAERSKLYSTRGLSSDTSLLPNYALERALASIKAGGLLAPSSVRRVAIIGPGLDFADKQDGYDFYPQQTIQPFAVIDTLLRLGLARAGDLKVTTFDLSSRVNDHLTRARMRAGRGASYVVQLPRDAQAQWKQEAINYWASFGDQIGKPVAAAAVPAGMEDVKVRAVSIRPAIVSLITAEDANIVLQRPALSAPERFDLMIATNILVYYDVFEQSLALANVGRMLRPGGLLLSNNALLELPSSAMRSVGYETVVYSDRPNDGDHIVWYQRAAQN